jgi:exodeoxyribonuclease VII small subunit
MEKMTNEIEKLSFEQALEKLEGIVKELEDENIALSESISKFEEGVKLSGHCLNKLNEAEKKIEELTRTKDGSLITKELELKD